MSVFSVQIRILHTFVYGLSYVYGFLCALSGFCVHIRIFVRYERLLRMDMAFWFLESFGDPISGIFDLLKVSMIRSWGFIDLLKVPMILSWGFFDLLKVCANACDDLTVWRIRLEDPIFRFPSSSLSLNILAITRLILLWNFSYSFLLIL